MPRADLAQEGTIGLTRAVELFDHRRAERHYGLNDTPPQSDGEIGALLGVSEERSRQIEREALHRLRTAICPT